MKNDLGGMDQFVAIMTKVSNTIQNPAVKKEIMTAMVEPIIEQAKKNVRSGAKQQTGTLEDSIVAKISTDGNQALIGWSKNAPYGPLLEDGFHHTVSHKFIKLPHLRPALNAKKYDILRGFDRVCDKYLGENWDQ